MTFRSPFVRHALILRDRARASYSDFQYAEYEKAERVTRGRMLNERGERKGIDSFSLFEGTEVRALAYASEELVDYWRYTPRVPFEDYERQMFDTWLNTGSIE